MAIDQLPEDWKIIRSWLPEDLDELARRHGFTSRSTGLQDVECWLRLILMHVAGGLSLKQTVVRAGELGLAKLSSVALFKRMRKAEVWLQSLAQHVLKEQRQKMGQKSWPWKETIRVVDATTIEEPGATGTSWRVHYSLRLPDLACDHYELTDARGGEKLGRFIFKRDEIVLADRGYCHRAGAAQVIDSQASLIMRWQSAIFPLEDARENSFKALAQVRSLKIGQLANGRFGSATKTKDTHFACAPCARVRWRQSAR